MYQPINSWRQKSFIVSAYSIWYGRTQNTFEYMKDLKDANINLVIPCDEPSVESELSLLEELEEIGLPFLTASKSIFCEKEIDSEQQFSEYINKIKDYKSFYGFYIWDEPREEKYEAIRHNQDLTEKYAQGKATYICLLPSYGPFYWDQEENGADSFCRYVDSFCETSKPAIISNDYYPYYDENTDLCVHNIWRDMGYLRIKSLELDIPYWHVFQAICDCTNHGYGFLTPELIEVQINCALAYGVKSVSYFLCSNIILDNSGEKSEYYDSLAEINRRTICMGNELFDAKSVAVYHGGIGDDLRQKYYAEDINDSKILKSIPDKLIVGEFLTVNDEMLLAIANKDYKNAVCGEVVLKSKIKISEFDGKDSYHAVSDENSSINIGIEPGGILLYKLERII